MDKCLITIYKTILLYGGKISQEADTITVKIPQHLTIEENSFYMVHRIHIAEGRLWIRDHE